MKRRAVAAGVDFGGSWLRLSLLSSDGNPVQISRVGAPRLDQLPTQLGQHLKSYRRHLHVLLVAAKGVWTTFEKRQLARSLSSLARKVIVWSDVEAAWQVTFGGPDRSDGILLAAGTGSIAYGQDKKGRAFRAGGLGPLLGDEGSAFWIGRDYLKQRAERFPGATVARVAQVSQQVFREARAGRPQARKIIRAAAAHLAQLVSSVEKQGSWSNPILWSTHGSLWKNSGFQKQVERLLPRRRSRHWKWIAAPDDLVTALAHRALQDAG